MKSIKSIVLVTISFLFLALIPAYASDNATDTELRVYDASTGAAVTASTTQMTVILVVKGDLLDKSSYGIVTPSTVNFNSVVAQDFTGVSIPVSFSQNVINIPVSISEFEESGETIINMGTITLQKAPKNGLILNAVTQTNVNYGNQMWRAGTTIAFNS